MNVHDMLVVLAPILLWPVVVVIAGIGFGMYDLFQAWKTKKKKEKKKEEGK